MDATYSMVTSKLWGQVTDDLAKAIDAIGDATTEIYVVAFGGKGGCELLTWHDYATQAGKSKIINGFRGFKPQRNTMTYLNKPLNDFYNNKVSPDKVTYCFLMTDGQDENKDPNLFPNALKQWGAKYGDANVYGFYVMLNQAAKNDTIVSIIDEQKHLWKVETADININLIRLDNNAVFNVRNDDSIEIPVTGKTDGIKFNATFPADSGFKVKRSRVKDGKLVVEVDVTGNKSIMPVSSNHDLSISLSGADKFDFLVTDKVSVKCNNKKEYVINSPTERQKFGEVSHYDEFLFVPGRIVPISSVIEFFFNEDAKADNNAFAEFAFVNNEGQVIGSEDMLVTIDGKTLNENRFRVTPSHSSVKVEISFSAKARKGRYQGYLRMVEHNLHRLNNTECSGQTADAFQWVVYNNKTMNPLAKTLMWLGILIALALLSWFVVIKQIKYPRFSTFTKMVLVKKNGRIVAQFTCKFKGARRVVFATEKQPQSALNRFFTGRIDTVINPNFVEPITFLPKNNNMAMAIGNGYLFNPNPIPRNGRAEISAPAKQLIINLQ